MYVEISKKGYEHIDGMNLKFINRFMKYLENYY